MLAAPATVEWNGASASISATCWLRVTTSSATASISPHGWRASPNPAASAFPKMLFGGTVRLAASAGTWQAVGHDDITEPVSRLPLPVRGHRACGLALSLLQPELARC